MGVLIGMSQDVKGKQVEIGPEPVSIGRRSENVIPIDNATVSGKHCEVLAADGRYLVRDLGSTNGTRVNNRDIKESVLRPKDILQVGSIEFMFDASPGEVIEDDRAQTANVEVAPGPAAAPASFGNISPFGSRSAEKKGVWFLIIAGLGLAALAAVVVLLFRLISES